MINIIETKKLTGSQLTWANNPFHGSATKNLETVRTCLQIWVPTLHNAPIRVHNVTRLSKCPSAGPWGLSDLSAPLNVRSARVVSIFGTTTFHIVAQIAKAMRYLGPSCQIIAFCV
jgi:hypothetical protein